jgi:hypothetical protein
MTGNPNSFTDIGLDIDADPITLSLILNILVTVVLTGFSAYWALSHFRIPKFLTSSSPSASYPGSPSSQPICVFISLFVAITIGVAEVGVYSAYLRKLDRARSKEKSIVEKKELVGEVVTSEETGEIVKGCVRVEEGEREDIWGKGVNGGARRRIRE